MYLHDVLSSMRWLKGSGSTCTLSSWPSGESGVKTVPDSGWLQIYINVKTQLKQV